MKLFFFKANEETERNLTGARTKFSAVGKSTFDVGPGFTETSRAQIRQPHQQVFQEECLEQRSASRLHIGTSKDASNTPNAETAGVKTWRDSSVQPWLRTPAQVGASPASLSSSPFRHLLWEFTVSFPISIV